ncbi:MAG: AraC family transcriptional regulator [Spirochaetota bacterium]
MLEKVLDTTLAFDYVCAGIAAGPHANPERALPCALVFRIRDGEADIRTDRACHAASGDAMIIPPGTMHTLSVSGARVTSEWVHVNYSLFGSIDLFTLIDAPLSVAGASAAAIGHANERLAKLDGTPFSLKVSADRKAAGFELLSSVLAVSQLKENAFDLLERARPIAAVLQYIRDNVSARFDRNDLASMAGLSPARFHDVFRSVTGTAPMEYVGRYRMRAAEVMLIGSDRSIAEIAKGTGFRDQFYFSRAFKRSAGVSPSEFREMNRTHMHTVPVS